MSTEMVPPPVESTATALSEWLQAEIHNSHTGRNRTLDNWSASVEALRYGFDDEATRISSGKMLSHWQRYKLKVGAYEDFADSDRYVGTLMHHSLMFVSGGRRLQCVLEASSAEEYLEKRLRSGQPVGIDVAQAVAAGIREVEACGLWGEEATPDFKDYLLAANDAILEEHRAAYGQQRPARSGFDPESKPAQAMCTVQRLGVGLAVGNMIMAASMRGWDYNAVPILEAKSITDASPTPAYPFPAEV